MRALIFIPRPNYHYHYYVIIFIATITTYDQQEWVMQYSSATKYSNLGNKCQYVKHAAIKNKIHILITIASSRLKCIVGVMRITSCIYRTKNILSQDIVYHLFKIFLQFRRAVKQTSTFYYCNEKKLFMNYFE